jgi:hypothetical protein
MRKFFLFLIAAFFATSSGANAKNDSVTIDLVGGCGLNITHKGIAYVVQYSAGCGTVDGQLATGQGLARWNKDGSMAVQFSDTYQPVPDPENAVGIDISLPLMNGGKWTGWFEHDGITSYKTGHGHYIIGQADETSREFLKNLTQSISAHKN